MEAIAVVLKIGFKYSGNMFFTLLKNQVLFFSLVIFYNWTVPSSKWFLSKRTNGAQLRAKEDLAEDKSQTERLS